MWVYVSVYKACMHGLALPQALSPLCILVLRVLYIFDSDLALKGHSIKQNIARGDSVGMRHIGANYSVYIYTTYLSSSCTIPLALSRPTTRFRDVCVDSP